MFRRSSANNFEFHRRGDTLRAEAFHIPTKKKTKLTFLRGDMKGLYSQGNQWGEVF